MLFVHAAAKLPLVLILVMFAGISTSARTVDTRDPQAGRAALGTLPASSAGNAAQPEYADFRLSYSVRQLAHLGGLPPNTISHLCWDFNFLLMMALIFWKGGPITDQGPASTLEIDPNDDR
jgi:hypothetical protein